MIGVRECLSRGTERLAAAGVDSARLDARVLLAHAMGVPAETLIFAGAPTPEQHDCYESLIARRAAREPLAYIVGRKEFWSLPFAVGPGVLIPRPETETLVDEAMRTFPDRNQALDVLDLGTGSGCLLIAFLSEYPNARGVGIDESAAALDWARRNAAGNGVERRCTWLKGGWDAGARRFDVIFSNPPYLASRENAALTPEIANFEPPGALYGGEDGLDAYRALGPVIAGALRPGGWAGLEIGMGQLDRVCEILARSGLEFAGVTPDLSGIPRCVAVRLPSRRHQA